MTTSKISSEWHWGAQIYYNYLCLLPSLINNFGAVLLQFRNRWNSITSL